MAGDGVQNHVQVAQNLVVPEVEDHPTLGLQPVVAVFVVVILVVLFAIAFHNHSVGQAGEVDDEPTEDYLPAEMTVQLTPSQSNPEHCFGFCHPLPQLASAMLESPLIGFHLTNRARSTR